MNKTPDTVEIPDLVNENPLDLYNGSRLEIAVKQVEEAVRALVLDPSNPAEYKHFGSVARRVSSFKTSIDKIGDGLVRPIKAQCKDIDAKRKMVKDRMNALRDEFLAPRVAFDDAEVARVKFVADAFDLFQHGALKIGEFSKPTIEAWDALLLKVTEFEITEEVFKDQFDAARETRKMAVETIGMARSKWMDDEAALEAGRAALKLKQDEEAAERHAKRQIELAAEAEEKAKAKAAAPKAEAPAAAEKPAEEPQREREARVNRAILAKLKDLGLSDKDSKAVVCALYMKQIPHVSTDYNSAC